VHFYTAAVTTDRTAASTVAQPSGRPTSQHSDPSAADPDITAEPLNALERRQLSRLRRWGTVGSLLLMVGSASSYGAATPIPNPVDGLRIVGLLSRVGPPALACSYAGIGLIVMCWVLIGRLAAPGRIRRLSRSQLSHTLAMWAVPLLVTPSLFSRDVYSYLAIGSMMNNGFNPYEAGPYDTLGDADPFAHQVDVRWQHTPSPYGPVYLLIAQAVVRVTGENLIVATLLQRLVELVGVAMIVWALPRLARICGFDPVAALWLGALNPLVLFHLIGGGHNEALMLGAMLAGMVIAWERSLVAGVVVITLGVGVKATAGMALAFLVIMLALRAGGRWRDLFRCGLQVGAVAVVTFAAFTAIAGVGFGWVAALGAPGSVRSFLSGSTSLGVGAGQMSRVDAVRIAVEKAREHGHSLEGAVLASDAFFPFADGPAIALEAGIGAIIQPGGSKRDDEVVAACDEAGAAMVFTGRRHFRH